MSVFWAHGTVISLPHQCEVSSVLRAAGREGKGITSAWLRKAISNGGGQPIRSAAIREGLVAPKVAREPLPAASDERRAEEEAVLRGDRLRDRLRVHRISGGAEAGRAGHVDRERPFDPAFEPAEIASRLVLTAR